MISETICSNVGVGVGVSVSLVSLPVLVRVYHNNISARHRPSGFLQHFRG